MITEDEKWRLEAERRQKVETDEAFAALTGASKLIADRLRAVKDALMAKGYDCPSVEVGLKIMKNYQPTFTGAIRLASPKNWCRGWTHPNFDAALRDMEDSIGLIPDAGSNDARKLEALEKLSYEDRKALGL